MFSLLMIRIILSEMTQSRSSLPNEVNNPQSLRATIHRRNNVHERAVSLTVLIEQVR